VESKAEQECEKLVKLATDRTGTIKTNEAIGNVLSVDVAKRVVALVDVKARHEQAHPNLVPATLIKKLFILERAMQTAHHRDHEVMTELLEVTLTVTPEKDQQAYLDAWRLEGDVGWQSYKQNQVDQFTTAK